MWIVALNLCIDTIKGVFRGTSKALGIFKNVLAQNIACNWVLNFTAIYVLCFYFKYGLTGLWISKVISETVAALLYFITISKQDWDEIGLKVKNRIKSKN